MYRSAVKYKDHGYLAPGSRAFELYHDKSDKGHKLLDQHMAEVDAAWRKLEGRKNGK
ncbi:hypothetical protein Voja6_00082 [Pseudomonas phage vB_PpuM-Voja-6]